MELDEVREAIESSLSKIKKTDRVILVGFRGYYRDQMGQPGVNDVGMYDDAHFWIGPNHFSSWNANTDPTRYGWNAGVGKYMARLQPGVWRFIRRVHRGKYQAFGQGENPVIVDRVKADGTIAKSERGCFGIDIHLGGDTTTSSEGCQTLPEPQWRSYKLTGYDLLARADQDSFPYILLSER